MRQEDGDPPELPPRPNPGPEPWPEAAGPSPWWMIGLAPLAIGAAWWIRRRRAVAAAEGPSATPASDHEPRSAADRLVALALSVREAMADRVGASWAAKTTEEIAAALGGVDPAVRSSALRVLAAADRARFAGREVDDDHLALAESWAAEALAGLRPEGARSIQNGR